MITISAPGINTDSILRDIHSAVEKKKADGVYQKEGLGDASQQAPLSFSDNESFLAFYLENLRENAFVDISDFEILERRIQFRTLLVRFKKLIWATLRFYTYRLWSQQNQINGLLLAAVDGVHEQQIKKIALLEARIQALEGAGRPVDGG